MGCGHGWSTIAVQAAWPSATVIGLDTDEASVAEARGHADAAGVAARFEVAGGDPAVELASYGPVDVVLILEALHDMARPGDILRAARAALAPGGMVVIADEAVAEVFSAPGDDLERMMYGWSVTHCLPAAMAEPGSAALGTALRPATVAAPRRRGRVRLVRRRRRRRGLLPDLPTRGLTGLRQRKEQP